MLIPIYPNLALQDIQAAFRKAYPNLKLEFFKTRHEAGESSHARHMLDHHLILRKFIHDNQFELDISGSRTVAELEKDIQDQMGISGQVFRLAHDIWIETTETDNWTLDHQNQQAEALKKESSDTKSWQEKLEDRRMDME